MSYETEVVARDRIRERLLEAERERMARPRKAARAAAAPRHARIGIALVRRLTRMAQAS
ncbi:MAG TPA: hypothetical protein VK194_11185 [Candidatus Deferrimicrobium sp.]|nr:hypothetical protein [Candidatus Deferrimicrobium sp.]